MYLKIVYGVGLLAIAFISGWGINGWRLDAEISDLKKTRSDEIAKQYKDAADDLKAGAQRIKTAADDANLNIASLGQNLDILRKDFKNAKPPALPAGCVLDSVRMRGLAEAAATTNEAFTRLRISPSLQTNNHP